MDSETEGTETQLVVYQLAGQEFGVEIGAVREIIRVPPTLRKVPKARDHVAGHHQSSRCCPAGGQDAHPFRH